MVPLALGCIWIGGLAFAGLVALITIGMALEWLHLCAGSISLRRVLLFACLPSAVLITAFGAAAGALVLLTLITIVAVAGIGARAGGGGLMRPLPLGIPYIGLAAISLIWLRRAPDHGRADVIVLLLVIWATDIGAYVAGRALGGPRLAPRISTAKTWSGAAGGLVAAMAVGYAAAGSLGAADARWRMALLAGALGCVGQAGDLFESFLKRRFRVKDTGSLIPGHGGLLDRLDAVLAAAPASALVALVLGRGVIPWQ